MEIEEARRIMDELPWLAWAGCTPGVWFFYNGEGKKISVEEWRDHLMLLAEAIEAGDRGMIAGEDRDE